MTYKFPLPQLCSGTPCTAMSTPSSSSRWATWYVNDGRLKHFLWTITDALFKQDPVSGIVSLVPVIFGAKQKNQDYAKASYLASVEHKESGHFRDFRYLTTH